jgi:small subunit ribosomal protein S3
MGIPSKGGTAANARVHKLRKRLPESITQTRAGIAAVDIERFPGKVKLTIHTARPGVLIGRKGRDIKIIRDVLNELVGQNVDIDVKEVQSPDTSAVLVAQNIAEQLERRVSYRRAMKRAMQQAMRAGAKGIKIMVSGRLAGADMARTVWLREGRVPLQTLRADIDYAKTEATTTYGQIGIKVWIYKGEVLSQANEEEQIEATEGVYVSK